MTWEDAVVSLGACANQAALVRACYYDPPIEVARRYHAGREWKALRELLLQRRDAALNIGSSRGMFAVASASGGDRTSVPEPDPSASDRMLAVRAALSGAPGRLDFFVAARRD